MQPQNYATIPSTSHSLMEDYQLAGSSIYCEPVELEPQEAATKKPWLVYVGDYAFFRLAYSVSCLTRPSPGGVCT